MNSLNIDIESGSEVILVPGYCDGDEKARCFVCHEGPGMSTSNVSTAIMGKFVDNNRQSFVDGNKIEKLIRR